MRLPISPTLLTKLSRSHAKKFHTNISFIQHVGEISPHSQGTMMLLDGSMSQ
jgi:hypothetical protein